MLDVDAQMEYWNRIGPTKPFSHPLAIDRLNHWIPASGQLVDIGCGYGRTLQTLASAGYQHLGGVDPAPAMAVSARARGVPAPIIVGDARCLPIRDRCANVALLLAVLTCIPTDAGQRGVLVEIRRILRLAVSSTSATSGFKPIGGTARGTTATPADSAATAYSPWTKVWLSDTMIAGGSRR